MPRVVFLDSVEGVGEGAVICGGVVGIVEVRAGGDTFVDVEGDTEAGGGVVVGAWGAVAGILLKCARAALRCDMPDFRRFLPRPELAKRRAVAITVSRTRKTPTGIMLLPFSEA